MYQRILKRLFEIQDYYTFDIYNYQTEENPCAYSYLLVLHRDNGIALRQALSKILALQDSRTIFIISHTIKSKKLEQLKKQGKITEELA